MTLAPAPTVYEAAFQSSPVGEYLLSPTPEATILAVNDAFLRATGRAREELVGTSLFVAFPGNPDDPQDTGVAALRKSLAKVVASGAPHTLALQRYPIRVVGADGVERFDERFWSAVSTPVFDDEGRMACIAHSTMDVTDMVAQKAEIARTRAELDERGRLEAGTFTRAQAIHEVNRALEAERSRLWLLFEHAPGFVYFTRGPGHVVEQANNALFDLVGPRRVVGRTVRDAFPEAVEQGFLELHDQVFRTGKPYIGRGSRVLLSQGDGPELDERFIDFVYQPMRGADGQVTGICAQGIDITERRRAEQEVRDASRRKDEFLAMLAHELRNPLAPISAAATLLQHGARDPELLQRTSDIIGRQVLHMTGLVDDLLDVSRVTRGLIVMERKPQDMKEIVASAIEQVRPMVEAKHHRLAIELAHEQGHVEGDHKRLVQVLTNLLNNAARYTPRGGHIRLQVDVTPDHVLTRVTDDGIGIAPDMQQRVFELFAQADRPADRSLGGLGLGLALVKTLVELHGGWVRCASDGEGKGSCFTVCLPRLHEAPAPMAASGRAGMVPHTGGGRRVLLVDDNVDAADTLSALLRAFGHEVAVEYRALAALASARTIRPDVCLLDIGLPDMSGLELARRLRADTATADCILVALTGYGQDADRQAAHEASFDAYLVKPVALDDLFEALAAGERAASPARASADQA